MAPLTPPPTPGRPPARPRALARTLAVAVAVASACGPPGPHVRPTPPGPTLPTPLRSACTLAALFPVVDLRPAGLDGVAARVVAQDVDAARARLRARFPHGPPPGLARVTVEAPRPRLAVVIDDLGLHEAQLGPLWRLGEPLTYAILPGHRWSRPDEAFLDARGATILVHVPMESVYPSQMTIGGYLRADQPPAERRARWLRSLAAVPAAVGFNNHQGSAFTAHAELLMPLVEALPPGFIVLDSRTTAATQLATLGQALGHPTASRDVFLDNRRDPAAGLAQLEQALAVAQRRGQAVVIGHPYPETVQALRRFLDRHAAEVHLVGVERVTDPPVPPAWRRRCPPTPR